MDPTRVKRDFLGICGLDQEKNDIFKGIGLKIRDRIKKCRKK